MQMELIKNAFLFAKGYYKLIFNHPVTPTVNTETKYLYSTILAILFTFDYT